MAPRNKRPSGFTLLEMSLTLFLISGALVLGGRYQPVQFQDWQEHMVINHFKETWDNALSYSLTRHTIVAISFYQSKGYVRFLSGNGKWCRYVRYPKQMTIQPKNGSPVINIRNGNLVNPQIIEFKSGQKTTSLTAQMHWGRLDEK